MAYHMYSRQNCEKFPQQVQMQLCQKPETISKLFIIFLKSTWNFTHFEKKDQNILVPWFSDSLCLRTPFESQRVNVSQTLLKPARQHFLPNVLLMPDKLSWNKSLLVISEILELCFNTLSAYHMYSPKNWEKFHQQV